LVLCSHFIGFMKLEDLKSRVDIQQHRISSEI
jgi:hypothetical protein